MVTHTSLRTRLAMAACTLFLLELLCCLPAFPAPTAMPWPARQLTPSARLSDRIVLRNGGVVECKIVSLSSDILYFMRPDQDLEQVPVNQVLRVEFGDSVPTAPAPIPAPEASAPQPTTPAAPATPEVVTPPTKASDEPSKPTKGNAVIPAAAPTASWKDVKVTKDSAECQGMLYVDKYDVTLTQSRNLGRMTSDDLEKAAVMQLQKKAVQRRATLLYIRKVEFIRAYGEPPSIRINAAAYKPNSRH